ARAVASQSNMVRRLVPSASKTVSSSVLVSPSPSPCPPCLRGALFLLRVPCGEFPSSLRPPRCFPAPLFSASSASPAVYPSPFFSPFPRFRGDLVPLPLRVLPVGLVPVLPHVAL